MSALLSVGLLGFVVITVAIALPVAYTAARSARAHRYLATASGCLSLALGPLLAYQIRFVDGLFTGQPGWAPE